jgi:PAS domain S-box-containing protein
MDGYGYTREELLKMNAVEFRAPEVKSAFAEQANEAKIAGKTLYETIHKRKDGTTFPVEISLRAIKIDEKVFYQAIIRDITERKKLEEELARAREMQYRTLVENLPQKVYLKDRNSAFVSCNENYAKDLKIKPGEIAGCKRSG